MNPISPSFASSVLEALALPVVLPAPAPYGAGPVGVTPVPGGDAAAFLGSPVSTASIMKVYSQPTDAYINGQGNGIAVQMTHHSAAPAALLPERASLRFPGAGYRVESGGKDKSSRGVKVAIRPLTTEEKDQLKEWKNALPDEATLFIKERFDTLTLQIKAAWQAGRPAQGFIEKLEGLLGVTKKVNDTQDDTARPSVAGDARSNMAKSFRANNTCSDATEASVADENRPETPVEESGKERATVKAKSPGQLYADHYHYAERVAYALFKNYSHLGSFGREEFVDAALEGLLTACTLWEEGHESGASFETFAFWYIKGRIIDRATEMGRFSATSDYEFQDEKPKAAGDDRSKRIKERYDENSVRRSEGYIEEVLSQMQDQENILTAFGSLMSDGNLSQFEADVGELLLKGKMNLQEISDERGYNLSKVRVAAAKLINKIRSRLRSEFTSGLTAVLSQDALPIAREALVFLKGSKNRPGFARAKPLRSYKGFMPGIDDLRRAAGEDWNPVEQGTDVATVISFYRHLSLLRNKDIAPELEMNLAAVHRMGRLGRFDSRRSIPTILKLANTLGIDPVQILLRANPYLQDFFGRVINAGDDVYLSVIDVNMEPGEILPHFKRNDSPDKAHAFGDIIKSYRIWSGVSSARDLGTDYVSIEQGGYASPVKLMDIAKRIHMSPLLMLLGTWPELISLFDVVDSDGNLIRRGSQEYSRIVIVLNKTEASSPDMQRSQYSNDLQGFVKFLFARHGAVFTSNNLDKYGLSHRILATLLGGDGCQNVHLANASRLLGLNPFEEAELVVRNIAARAGIESNAAIGRIAEAAAYQGSQLRMVGNSAWSDMEDVVSENPAQTEELTRRYLSRAAHPNGWRRLSEGYLRELASLWKLDVPGINIESAETAAEPGNSAAHGSDGAIAKQPPRMLSIEETLELSKDLRGQKRYEEARRILVDALRSHPENMMILTELGYAALAEGKPDEAAEYFLSVLRYDRYDTYALLGLGMAERRRRHLREARSLLLKALDEDDRNGNVLNELGWLAYERGNKREAKTRFLQTLRYHPGDEDALRGLREIDKGEASAGGHESSADSVKALTMRAQQAMENGDFSGARRSLLQAYGLKPDDRYVTGELGQVALREGNVSEAKRWYEEALQTEEGADFALNQLGWIAIREGRLVDARAYFDRNVHLHPDNVRAWTNLGFTYVRMEEHEKAAECYKKGLEQGFDLRTMRLWFQLSKQTRDVEPLSWFIAIRLRNEELPHHERKELEEWDKRVSELKGQL